MDFTEAAIKIGASGQNQVIPMKGYFVHQSIEYWKSNSAMEESGSFVRENISRLKVSPGPISHFF